MIVKILSRHSPSYRNLIDYILQNGKVGQVITHNLRSDEPEGWTNEFLENESYRKHLRKGQVYLYHEILSFSNEEESEDITPEMLDDIARKYIELRGTEGVYLASVHTDKDHRHIHFCTSGVKLRTGQAMRMSHAQLYTLKRDLQEYHLHKYPGITQSTCAHGKGKSYTTDKEWYPKQTERNLVKASIIESVKMCYERATTRKDFLSLLQQQNLHHYERNGQPTGITTADNMKFRFTRLGIDLKTLPPDTREEQQTLSEIQRIRESRKEQRNILHER